MDWSSNRRCRHTTRATTLARRALVLAIVVAGVGPLNAGTSSASLAAADKPCDLSSGSPVSKVFETKFDHVTNGRGPLRATCTYFASVTDPCILSVQVGITVKPYKSTATAAKAFDALSVASQSLPKQTVSDTAEPLTREDLTEIGDGAYFTNGRGGSVVFLDDRRVVGLIGGFGVSDQLPTCPAPDQVAAENRERLIELATRLTT